MSGFPFPGVGARSSYFEDFLGIPGGVSALPNNLFGQRRAGAGSGDPDFVADVPNGLYRILTDGTSEQQSFSVDSGDHLWINLSKKPIVSFRVRLNFSTSGGFGGGGDYIVMGVGSDYNANPDSVATNCWFKVTGAGLSVFVESDDGVLDIDDEDSTLEVVDNEWATFKIDFSDLSNVLMYVNGKLQESGTTINMGDLSANTVVQPYFFYDRPSGTAVETIDLDWLEVSYER